MLTTTVWLLIFAATGHRPAVVIDKYINQAQCEAAKIRVENTSAGGNQQAFCLKSEH